MSKGKRCGCKTPPKGPRVVPVKYPKKRRAPRKCR